MRTAIVLLLLIALPSAFADSRKDIDAFTRRALDVAGTTPGLAVIVVKDNQIAYRGEFGLRDVETNLPVTPQTRFYLASSTKAFTAMTAAILAVEGKLDLDEPVSTYWPELKLPPPLDAQRLSLRDFLAMRPGLKNDTLNFRSAIRHNIDDEHELLRVLETYSSPQPRTFRYSNMSYEIAAHILEKITGKRWQELSAEKVFGPLAMTSTTSTVPPPGAEVARLYRSSARGVFTRNSEKNDAMMGPAGGTFTTTADAARWIMAMINDGRAGQRQVLPSRAVRLAQSPQTTQKARWRYFDRWGWGLGQDLGEYEGQLLVHRFGGFNRAYSHISFMPDRRIGVAVFSNGGSLVADTGRPMITKGCWAKRISTLSGRRRLRIWLSRPEKDGTREARRR